MMKKLFLGLSTVFVFFHLYTAMFGAVPNGQKQIHLMFILTLLYLDCFMRKDLGKKLFQTLDLVFMVGSLFCLSYIIYITDEYLLRGGYTYDHEVAIGVFILASLLYATYKAGGIALPIVAGAFILYAFYGAYMPGVIRHGGYSLRRFIHLIVYSSDGIFGSPLNAAANYIVLFIILGAVFNETGVGDYFTSVATAAFGRFRGGPAKVAVVASGLFGSISGSSIANVVGTGTFTIPMMKNTGFDPETAGAVEAAASTGGQIMPPIMGSAAFLMAELLQVSYYNIIKVALIPAILYFTAIFFIVDLYALKKNISGVRKEDLPSIKKLIKNFYLFLPLILLVIFIGPMRLTITRAGVYTCLLTCMIVSFSKDTRFTVEKAKKVMISSARGTLSVSSSCALIGIIIGTVLGSGLGYRLSTVLVDLAGGHLALLLILTMLVSLVLGMGMPTTAAYLVLATLVAPAIVKMGVPVVAAHMFIFYFGIISNVTPPVAMAAYAAAGIANCNPSRCGYRAFQLSLSGFILPFMFVYNPILLGDGTWYRVLYSLCTALLGVYCISCFIEKCFIHWRIGIIEQVMLVTAALLLIDQNFITDFIGALIFAAVFIYRRYVNKWGTPSNAGV